MALCAGCERAGAAHPVREPVLVGDVLAGLADLVARPTPRALTAVSEATRPAAAVPQQRVPSAAGRETAASAVPGTPSTAVCDRCGARAEWHRTVRGRWVMIEPAEQTARLVPAGRRWRIAGDGTAVNLGSAVPSDTCRVSHFDVCPARPAPADSPVLLALWRSHARRTA
ncbi:DUF6083 domain-containing protein [Streptomyces sp. NPDC002825]|uniref:DUF6083 domain-containing protein n=1 Tax=Streptomyces sp. NPDC002825 TaxID=3154666 RepID=UPI00331CAA45